MTTETREMCRGGGAAATCRKVDVASVRIDAAAPATDADAASEWDAFVDAHPEGSLGQLAGARTMGTALPGVTDRSLVARDGDGRVVGVFPLFETSTPALRVLRRRSLVSGCMLPGGPLADAALPAKDHARLLDRLHEEAEGVARRIRADELVVGTSGVVGARAATETWPVSPLLRHGYRDAPRAGLLLDVTRDEGTLFDGLDPACRNKIRRCRREHVTPRVLIDRDRWMACQAYSQDYDRPNRFPPEFFGVLWDEFVERRRAVAVAVMDGDEILSVILMSLFHGTSYYWFTFARQPQRPPGLNNLALWESILAAKACGARVVELGSLEFSKAKESTISRFKQGFGGRPYVGWAGTKDLRPARRAALELAGAAAHWVRGGLGRATPARDGLSAEAAA